MLFTEFRFLPFFLLAFAVHWALRGQRSRKVWLLGCSYAFYAAWDWRFLSLILLSTGIDYVVGLKLRGDKPGRKQWIVLSLIVNLGLLAVFKYFDFFIDSALGLLEWFGMPATRPSLEIVLPVGISFYTFQTLSYSIDVYRRKLAPVTSLLDLATFVAFFPQLVAGPIVRASDFLPQLKEKRKLSWVDFRGSLMLFLVGFIKKACISDNIAPIVDEYFTNPGAYDALAAWNATLYYAAQIYCDFSGYSDMAIACACLLGYGIPDNFRWPYFAGDITAFWRRWHMSLSSWLRDYLYIPLGGSRGSQLFTYRNLMLTMLLGGLWHGAAWNFVIWGGLHGAALIVHKQWSERLGPDRFALARRVGGPVLTFWFVCVCWIFFRAVGVENSTTALQSFVLFTSPGAENFGLEFLWILPILGLAHLAASRRMFRDTWKSLPDWGFAFAYGLAWAAVLAFVPVSREPFIYFQF